jgi:hypothetical protein
MNKGYALLSAFLVFLLVTSASHENIRDIKKLDLNAEGVNSLSQGALTVDMDFGKFPLYFISNKGQVHEKARFYAKTSRYTLWLTKKGLVFDSVKKVKVDAEVKEETAPFGQILNAFGNDTNKDVPGKVFMQKMRQTLISAKPASIF